MIDQMRRAVRHATAATAGAEATAFAREGHQPIFAAGGATEPCKAGRETTTRQEITELALDKARQTSPIARRLCVGAERLEVITHDLVQGALLRPARMIDGRDPGGDQLAFVAALDRASGLLAAAFRPSGLRR